MLKRTDEGRAHALAATPALDDLEREALETVYRPPSQRSIEDAGQRFPMDEAMLISVQEVHRMLQTVVVEVQVSGRSEKQFFCRGLKRRLL
ncbi:hypothetical protein [Pseudomonas sp. L1(2025)]|uniref:hypothetical protein n=1 Tax=Pseudomonas sp. L1(2025) TaxID=3449429 RepID=UPI003F68C175